MGKRSGSRYHRRRLPTTRNLETNVPAGRMEPGERDRVVGRSRGFERFLTLILGDS